MSNLSVVFRDEKLDLVKLLATRRDLTERAPYTLSVVYHEIPLTFYLETETLREKLRSFFPLSWQGPRAHQAISHGPRREVFWFSPPENLSEGWSNDLFPGCDLTKEGDKEYVVQRDFAAVCKTHPRTAHERLIFVTPPEIGDGFFNTMRWFLPRRMFSADSVLLHSSCVIGTDGLAYFFLGHSGAGKTTLASLRGPRLVLGDDMNVLGFSKGRAFAELGLFGQSIKTEVRPGERFVVGGIYFLEKTPRHMVEEVSPVEAARRFTASCANLFWKNSEKDLASHVLLLASKVSKTVPTFKLGFRPDSGFWPLIEKAPKEDRIYVDREI